MNNVNPGLQEDTGSHLLNYLQLLWYRRKFIVLITLVVGVAGVVWQLQQAPVYRGTSSLKIGKSDADRIHGEARQDLARVDEIASEIEILRSRGLAAQVIQQLQLQIYNEFDPMGVSESASAAAGEAEQSEEARLSPALPGAIDIFLDKLKLERAGQSSVVYITFESRNPELAARIANAIPETYIESRLRSRMAASADMNERLTREYTELKEKLLAAERAESFYGKTFDLAESAEIDALDQALAELDSRLTIARARQASALDSLQGVESAIASGALPEVAWADLAAPELQRLADQRQALETQQLAPDLDDASRGRIEDALSANAGALRAELDRLVVALQKEAASASEEALALEAELTAAKLESSNQNRRLLQMRELERQTAMARVRFDAFARKLDEANFPAELITPDSDLISRADPDPTPLYPERTRNMVYAFVAGLLLALLLMLIHQRRNPGLLSPEHVQHLLGEQTIGVLPAVDYHAAPHDLVLSDPSSNFAEAVSALKVTLDLADLDSRVKAIQLVSTQPGEGRASLAVALARTEARDGRKSLLVSAHLRGSTVESKLGLGSRERGLTDLMLAEDGKLQDFVVHDRESGLDFLSAGTAEYANADVVFSSQRMQTIMDAMREQYDFIVIDTPPVMTTADAIAIGRLVDKTLLVVRWNKTPKHLVGSALRHLREGGVELAGVVLQHVDLARYGNIGFSDFGYLYHQRR